MGDRSLPPKVEGHPQGRLDLIFGRPAVFPPPQPSQSFIFTFRWWGDTQPCVLRLPPEKSETRITHLVTCSPHSFRQYLNDMRNLHVSLRIGGDGCASTSQDAHEALEQLARSPRRVEGETPRQRLLRRQQRLKKGWQDGDTVGSFVLPDLKLNTRGDYVIEGRILDSSGDMIGSVVVTMVFLEGTLEDFHQIKIQSDETVSLQPNISPDKLAPGMEKSRMTGIPIPEPRHGKTQKTPTQEGIRPRSWSFRESFRQKCDKLKAPKKQHHEQQQQKQQQQQQLQHQQQQQHHNHQQQQQQQYQYQHQAHSFDSASVEKENLGPPRRRASSFTKTKGKEGLTVQENLSLRRTSYQEGPVQHTQYTHTPQDGISTKTVEMSRQQNSPQIKVQDGKAMEVRRSPQLPRRAIPQKVEPKNLQVVEDPSPVVRRERKPQEGVCDRARPASWGLYPLLNGADPQSLVDCGAVRAEELPILLQVLEGRSPNLDLSNFDPNTQKMLDGLDLSLTSSGINGSSPGRFVYDSKMSGQERRGHAFSVFHKGRQSHEGEPSGVTVSGVWPLEEGKLGQGQSVRHNPPTVIPTKVLNSENKKYDSPKKMLPVQSRIPMSQGGKMPVKNFRSLSSRPGPDKKLFPALNTPPPPRENVEASVQEDKTGPEKYPAEEGSVLVVDIGTLTLSSPLLPPTPPEVKKKVTGARVLHRSRVCYLTTLDVTLPSLEPPSEWDLSQTCASRQLLDHEVHYDVREVLRLPPVPAADILKGHLVIKCVCRRLGERENEEVGSSSVSLADLWQLNGCEVEVPLFAIHPYGSLTRRLGRKARMKEDEKDKPHSFAHITLTTNLTLSTVQGSDKDDRTIIVESRHRSHPQVYEWNGDIGKDRLKAHDENLYSRRFIERSNLMTSIDSSSGSDLSEPKYSAAESRQHNQYSKPKILIPGYQKCTESSEFNSIYLPTHVSPNDKTGRGDAQYARLSGVPAGARDNTSGPQHGPRIPPPSIEPDSQGYQSTFLSVISEYNGSNNQPVESGGESPCITTAADHCADFIDYNTLGWQPGVETRREDQRGYCRVHLEILKGRNLPWIEGSDGIPQPPNCYVRTTVGALMVLTNVCRESVNPMWNFAADVLLPYFQLAQTNGSLILKVHHSPVQQRTSPDDLLLGFVSVDATSIWSGHVSLCGWYPLLDLRGSVRGHVKVSLTPHEPPLNVAVSNVTHHPVHSHSVGLPVNHHLPPTHHYAQCSNHSTDTHTDSMYYQGDSVSNSVLNSLPRTASAVPQFTTKNQREIYNQNLQGIKDSPSFEVNEKGTSQTSESCAHYKSPASNDKGEDMSQDRNEECAQYNRVQTGGKTQTVSRKTSSIPVFTSNKTSMKSPRPDDKSKFHSNLPRVDYKDKENVQPTTEVISQGYCRHKGAIIVKGLTKESCQNSSSDSESNHQQNLQKEDQESFMTKDSLIMSHFRMQKERHEGGEDQSDRVVLGSKSGPVHKTVMSSSGSDNSQSDSQHSATDTRSTSHSGNKPSSCLKAPGSPSLRVKHVTFAHKLVHHQNGEAKLASHFSQGEMSWRSHPASQHASLTREDGVSPRHPSNTHSLNLESSDLQIVPCREGDLQAQPCSGSVPGGITMNGYDITARPHDRTKEDLIMAFSWMNQSNECDTPCVSFIESKVPVQNTMDSNGTGTSKSPSDDRISGAPNTNNSTSPKKSRKLRSRIAANFTLK